MPTAISASRTIFVWIHILTSFPIVRTTRTVLFCTWWRVSASDCPVRPMSPAENSRVLFVANKEWNISLCYSYSRGIKCNLKKKRFYMIPKTRPPPHLDQIYCPFCRPKIPCISRTVGNSYSKYYCTDDWIIHVPSLLIYLRSGQSLVSCLRFYIVGPSDRYIAFKQWNGEKARMFHKVTEKNPWVPTMTILMIPVFYILLFVKVYIPHCLGTIPILNCIIGKC